MKLRFVYMVVAMAVLVSVAALVFAGCKGSGSKEPAASKDQQQAEMKKNMANGTGGGMKTPTKPGN